MCKDQNEVADMGTKLSRVQSEVTGHGSEVPDIGDMGTKLSSMGAK